MNPKEQNPLVAPVKLKDDPEKAVSEYYESKCRRLKVLKGPTWDQVPPSPAQALQDASRSLEATRTEHEESRRELQRRQRDLQQQWQEVENLQLELKECFLDTENKVKALSEGAEAPESEEAAAEAMRQHEAFLETQTSQLLRARDRIDDETQRLKPYMDMVARVAAETTGGGPESVLQHYERLCAAQSEMDARQAAALEQLQELRRSAQSFTAQALSKLDAEQAQVAALKEQLKNETEERDACEARLQLLRTASQLTDAEESQLRAAVTTLYEQLWRRYHVGEPPDRDIDGQCRYVQHTLVALQSLVQNLKNTKPPASASLEPQLSKKL